MIGLRARGGMPDIGRHREVTGFGCQFAAFAVFPEIA